MFSQSPDERLSKWREFRTSLEESSDPLLAVIQLWAPAPFVAYNHKVDPYNQRSWPTPWEIIIENKYDDFTRALMMGWTLKYTERFSKSNIQLRTIVDNTKNLAYNVILVDEKWVLNYDDNQPVDIANVPDSFRLENLVVIERPR